MSYLSRLDRFVANNRPAAGQLTTPQLKDWANSKGLIEGSPSCVRLAVGEGGFQTPSGDDYLVYSKHGLNYTWEVQMQIKNGVLVYVPVLHCESCAGGWDSELLAHCGISSFVVSLPEKIIALPIPAWCFVVGDDPWARIKATYCFSSEVGKITKGFRQKLDKLLAG